MVPKLQGKKNQGLFLTKVAISHILQKSTSRLCFNWVCSDYKSKNIHIVNKAQIPRTQH